MHSREAPIPTVGPEEYTRKDEELLREGYGTARVAILSGSALSVGVSQREDAPCIRKARTLGIPVVRRSTGGLGLWHAPGDIVWSLVLPRTDPRVGRDYSKAYSRLGTSAVRLLEGQGARAEWRPPTGPSGEYCLLSGRGAVLTVEGRALGGAAQHLTRTALLHHGVIAYRLDPSRLGELFDLSPELVRQSLAGLEQIAPIASPMEWAKRLAPLVASEFPANRT